MVLEKLSGSFNNSGPTGISSLGNKLNMDKSSKFVCTLVSHSLTFISWQNIPVLPKKINHALN